MGTTLRRGRLLRGSVRLPAHPPAFWTGRGAPSLSPPGTPLHLALRDRHLVEGAEPTPSSCGSALEVLTALRACHGTFVAEKAAHAFRRSFTGPLAPALAQCLGRLLAPKQVAALCLAGLACC